MVVQKIFQEIIRYGARSRPYAKQIVQAEDRAFNFAYRGMRPGMRRGVRHGLASGTALGSFISEDGIGTNGGQIQSGTPSYQPYKTRSRFPNRSSSKYPVKRGYRSRKRCTCYRKSRSMYYR